MLSQKDPLNNSSFETKATRDGYGEALAELGETNNKIVVLDADLSGSTKTNIFAKKFPNRFYNFGVAEQGLVGHAAGFAISGLIPVVSSFAIFLTGRAWEIVRNSVAYPNLNVKLVASHAGISLGEDGASHQIIEDIAIMRVIPNMTVIVPSDYYQTKLALQEALKLTTPVYIRVSRPKVPALYKEDAPFKIGKYNIIQEGEKIAFLATGIMVYEAWKLARLVEEKYKIRPWVVDCHTIKPIDVDTLEKVSSKVDKIITFEEHNVLAGFGSAVKEALNVPIPIINHGIYDVFGQSGTFEDLMDHYNLSAKKMLECLKQHF